MSPLHLLFLNVIFEQINDDDNDDDDCRASLQRAVIPWFGSFDFNLEGLRSLQAQ